MGSSRHRGRRVSQALRQASSRDKRNLFIVAMAGRGVNLGCGSQSTSPPRISGFHPHACFNSSGQAPDPLVYAAEHDPSAPSAAVRRSPPLPRLLCCRPPHLRRDRVRAGRRQRIRRTPSPATLRKPRSSNSAIAAAPPPPTANVSTRPTASRSRPTVPWSPGRFVTPMRAPVSI